MKKASVIKIGKKLQSIRKTHGYTQEKMAEKIECSTRYVGDIEQDRSKPSYEVLVKICNIFSGYLNIKDRKESNVSLYGFEKLKQNNKDTIVHLIEYFNNNA